MRPNSAEVLQGVQGALMTYVMPEVQSDFVRTELMLIQMLLGIVANGWDGAAQRLVDDNAALRSLASDAAAVLRADPIDGTAQLPDELDVLAGETDASIRISELSTTNDRLRDPVARLGVLLQDAALPEPVELRTKVIEHLQQELAALPHDVLGPRADG